jgi:hypothetical protein
VEKGLPQTQGEKRRQGDIRFFLLLIALLALVLLALATARIAGASTGGQLPPLVLPSDASSSSSVSRTHDETGLWIVGARPSADTERIAGTHEAATISRSLGIYAVDRDRADRFAGALRRAGLLRYAEPDVRSTSAGYPGGLTSAGQWWLTGIVDVAGTTPPPVTPNSPQLGLIEESLDPQHPDLLGVSIRNALSIGPVQDDHGTSIAAIAGSPAAPSDDASAGTGPDIIGVWPGMNMTLFPSGDSCLTATRAVLAAANSDVRVINMSYGFAATDCFSHYVATETAVKRGVLPVASAGNTFETGNIAQRPASDPHVISVSAVDKSSTVAPFATRNDKVDITAPGAGILAPVVVSTGGGTIERGWGEVNGTSFSSPMVAAAATWLSQARPGLSARQIGRALTASATDLGDPGRDSSYGEGLLNINRALAEPSVPDDPGEPNDDIQWVDGSLLKGPSPMLWTPTGRKSSIVATLSLQKDPADVYRVRLAPRRSVLITAAQFQGDVVLRVLRPTTRTIRKTRKQVLVKSDQARPKTEGVKVSNRKGRAQVVYVALTPSPRQASEHMRYRLSVSASK